MLSRFEEETLTLPTLCFLTFFLDERDLTLSRFEGILLLPHARELFSRFLGVRDFAVSRLDETLLLIALGLLISTDDVESVAC